MATGCIIRGLVSTARELTITPSVTHQPRVEYRVPFWAQHYEVDRETQGSGPIRKLSRAEHTAPGNAWRRPQGPNRRALESLASGGCSWQPSHGPRAPAWVPAQPHFFPPSLPSAHADAFPISGWRSWSMPSLFHPNDLTVPAPQCSKPQATLPRHKHE